MKVRSRMWTKVAVVSAAVMTMLACSSSDSEDGVDTSFCGSLANAYSKCGGKTTTCTTTMTAECMKLSGLLSPSALAAAATCIQASTCDTDPLTCLGSTLGKVTPTDAQARLVDSYCTSCSVAPAAACKTAFFGAAGSPGLGVALLPFGDTLLAAVEESCTSSSLGKTACQAQFSTCVSATATQVLVKTVSTDAITCVLGAIKDGLTGVGTGGGSDGGTAGGCKDCAGCCQDGTCRTGDEPTACGTGGAGCETCNGGATCKAGACAAPCGPDNCAGCCDASGACQTGNAAAACGAGGGACSACSGAQACDGGACIATSCKASCASGCCTSSGCQPGTAPTACGTGGGACTACGGGGACQAGKCSLSGTSLWDLVLVSATIPPKNASNGSWDGFSGLPDPKAVVNAGTAGAGSTVTLSDTLSPQWSAQVVVGVAANTMKAGITFVVADEDVAFDDPIGSCVIKPTDAAFNNTVQTATCASGKAGEVSFTLRYRLVPK